MSILTVSKVSPWSGAQLGIESVIAACPGVFGPFPLAVSEGFGPASAWEADGDRLARSSPFPGQTQRIPAKSELGDDDGAVAQLRMPGGSTPDQSKSGAK